MNDKWGLDKEIIMQDLIVKIDGKIVKIDALLVFYSRNPKTLEYGVNIRYREDSEKRGKNQGRHRQIQIFCEDRCSEEAAKALAQGICDNEIKDLTGYITERR